MAHMQFPFGKRKREKSRGERDAKNERDRLRKDRDKKSERDTPRLQKEQRKSATAGGASSSHCTDYREKDAQIQTIPQQRLQIATVQESAPVKSLQQMTDIDQLQHQVEQLQLELSETQGKLQSVTKERDEIRANIKHVLGPKLKDGSGERTMTEVLHNVEGMLTELLDHSRETGPSNATTAHGSHPLEEECKQLKRKVERLQRGPCEKDACARTKDSLQRKVEELTSQLHGPKCQRPECVKIRQNLRQKELVKLGPAVSAGKDMEKITGGDYGKLIARFEALTTSPDGLLGEFEKVMEPFEAKQLVSAVFKHAYTQSKKTVIQAIQERLEALFVLNKSVPKEEMEDASRGYGRLLHASGLKAQQAAYVKQLTQQVYGDLKSLNSKYRSTLQQIFRKERSILAEVVELAWEMVVLPNPIVISEPDTIADQTHDREFGYWYNPNPHAQLIYLRPVVYRSCQGDVACKAWVANLSPQVPSTSTI